VLYRKIFNFAMVCTESDHLNDRAVERETAAALESVFPRVALPSFISLSTTDKRVQLHELSNIVFGIRLFNKHIGKGGAQIPDLPGSLSEEMATLNATLKNHIAEVEVVLDQYADVLAYLRHPSRRDESRNSMLTKRLQSELVFWRQMQLFQQQLQDATRVAGEHLRSTRDVFHQDMTELRQIVGSKTSVPKEKVYPRFDALANMWNIFNEESVKVALYTNVYRAVVLFRDQPFKPALRGRDVEAARGASTVADNTTSQQGETKLIEGETEPAGETVLVPLHLLTSKSVRLEMKGFDPCAVALHDGLLLPGDPEVGYVRHRGLYYAVSDTASAGQFLADPEQMLKAIKQVARSTPELVHVLGLGSSFPTVAIHHMVSQGIDMGDGSLLYRGGIDMRASKEMGTQTDTHVVSSFIDKQYEWNEWALRRRALLLTNLRTKRTHSTQTADSHFRRDNATQHYHTQNNDAQTARSAGTMPRKESNYVTGLRGHPDEKMHVVNICLEI